MPRYGENKSLVGYKINFAKYMNQFTTNIVFLIQEEAELLASIADMDLHTVDAVNTAALTSSQRRLLVRKRTEETWSEITAGGVMGTLPESTRTNAFVADFKTAGWSFGEIEALADRLDPSSKLHQRAGKRSGRKRRVKINSRSRPGDQHVAGRVLRVVATDLTKALQLVDTLSREREAHRVDQAFSNAVSLELDTLDLLKHKLCSLVKALLLAGGRQPIMASCPNTVRMTAEHVEARAKGRWDVISKLIDNTCDAINLTKDALLPAHENGGAIWSVMQEQLRDCRTEPSRALKCFATQPERIPYWGEWKKHVTDQVHKFKPFPQIAAAAATAATVLNKPRADSVAVQANLPPPLPDHKEPSRKANLNKSFKKPQPAQQPAKRKPSASPAPRAPSPDKYVEVEGRKYKLVAEPTAGTSGYKGAAKRKPPRNTSNASSASGSQQPPRGRPDKKLVLLSIKGGRKFTLPTD